MRSLAGSLTFLSLVLPSAFAHAQVPSPLAFLGHEVGADRRLCNHTDLLRYFEAVDAASDRVALVDIGTTSYGRRMTMAVITSPQNHARLDELRTTSVRLCRARDDEATAETLVESGRAVVWIDAGLHATESIAGQNILELVWQMASRDDDEVRRILDEVVLLACPVNPDGLELVANAYTATGSQDIPILYQRFIGHDNNRDYYANNQQETRNVSRVFFTDWCPQIVYNHHQSAPSGTILFTPPFRDPFNYSADPLVMRGIDWVAASMNRRFASERKPGIISRGGAPYSGWWNGGLRSTCYFHNIIGILTEAFGHPDPTRIVQSIDRRLTSGDYPDPVPTQVWHARQTVEYLQTANFAILDHASRYRRELLRDIYRMGRNSIRRGSEDHWTATPKLVREAKRRIENKEDGEPVFTDPAARDPRVYVLPRAQRDDAAAVRMVQALQRSGIEVHVASADFVAEGRACEKGSFVVFAAQAFRPHVIDLFEPQVHPDDFKDGKPVPPYDSAGWTLSMQFGVEVIRCREALDGPFEALVGVADFGTSTVPASAHGWRIDPADSHAVIAVNRLMAAGVRVEREVDGARAYVIPRAEGVDTALVTAISGLGVAPEALAEAPARGVEQRAPRIGLFDVWGGHMPTGWNEWLFREFEFPMQRVFSDRIGRGGLRADFDALVFHTGLPGGRDLQNPPRPVDKAKIEKLQQALPAYEDWSTLPSRAVRLVPESTWGSLRSFVEEGGTLLVFGGECEKVVRQFELPIEVGTWIKDADSEGGRRRTRNEEFYVPGSLLGIEFDSAHPSAAGSPPSGVAMFTRSSAVLRPTEDSVHVIARYRETDTLASGWAVGLEHVAGRAAIAAVPLGKGRIVLFGADATYRGQPLVTIRTVFQVLHRAAVPL
ncbi:MAG: M14 metallopeptidase family protein [Planctomycetota bacterium]